MDRRGWLETSLVAVVSLFMSVTGPLSLLFMLPLQVLAVRRGERAFLWSASGIFLGNMVLKWISIPEAATAVSLFAADSAVLLVLIAGLYAVNFHLKSFRKVLGFLIVTAAAGLCSLPVLLYLGSDQDFIILMTGQIESVLVALKEASPGNSVFEALQPEGMYNIFRESFLSSYLAAYYFFLALTWRLGTRFGLRSMRQESEMPKLQEFNVPDRLVWLLFIPLTIVLLRLLLVSRGMNMDLGPVVFAVSNSLYIMGVLYGLQGYGLLQYLMEKRNVNPGIRKMMGWLIPLSLLIFPLNVIVVLLLPGLGVSELWINYRHNDKELVQ